ncbi:Ribokinase [Sphaceloma murrayae]|uniref:Ribokinase n=1 Tax=Sphaceloma murrayae TaxID=2082308 RepID=A0A2K1QNC3_9PEZI|nr:Ribokinase [Sphaceloma murrayae]
MAVGTVAVIGSLNVDFVTNAPRLPEAGETLSATSFKTGFGGKGANQAVACARLSSGDDATTRVKTMMVGNVGADSFGVSYLEALRQEGIDVSRVSTVPGQSTGIANIIVENDTGENRILLAANANFADMDKPQDLVPDLATVVVFQLEIPKDQVVHNCKTARNKDKYVMLNPAPAISLPAEIYSSIDCIIVNETEAEIMCKGQDKAWYDFFFANGVRDLAIRTLGSKGVEYVSREGTDARKVLTIPAQKVKVVDTTAAGDTFVGALATKIAEAGAGRLIEPGKAIDFANRAAAKTVERSGAMDAIPRFDEVK